MNDAGDEVITTVGMNNAGLLIYQYDGTGWKHSTGGPTTQGISDSTLGGNVNNAMFSKGSSDYLVYQNAGLGKCLVYKKVMGAWQDHNAVWSSMQIHPSPAVGTASCTLDTSIGLDLSLIHISEPTRPY